MKVIVEILLLGLAVFLGAKIIPGVHVDSFWTAVLAAVLISLANATIGTILRIFTLPINILTLGLVSFIITVLMILLVDNMMTTFNTSGFWAAAVLAIVVAVVKGVLGSILGTKDN